MTRCTTSCEHNGSGTLRRDTMQASGGQRRSHGCDRCTEVPEGPSGAGHLILRTPVKHMRARLIAALEASREPWRPDEEVGAGVYRVATGDVAQLARALQPLLSGPELAEIRALFEPAGARATAADYFAARSLGTLIDQARHDWLPTLLADGRLTTHFQPIVEAAHPNPVFGFECLMRGTMPPDEHRIDGAARIVYPLEMLEAARGADLLFQLDLSARLSAIRGAAAHQIRETVFINFAPAAIYDPAFCLRSTIEAIAVSGLSPAQVVFDVTETERVPTTTEHLCSILDHYRTAGFRVALDDLGAGYSSLVLLGDVRPDFVKLDKGLTHGVGVDPIRAIIAEKLIETALATGMAVVAEGIETADAAEWFASRGVQYLQGYYFARPAAAPPRPAPAWR